MGNFGHAPQRTVSLPKIPFLYSKLFFPGLSASVIRQRLQPIGRLSRLSSTKIKTRSVAEFQSRFKPMSTRRYTSTIAVPRKVLRQQRVGIDNRLKKLVQNSHYNSWICEGERELNGAVLQWSARFNANADYTELDNNDFSSKHFARPGLESAPWVATRWGTEWWSDCSPLFRSNFRSAACFPECSPRLLRVAER